MEREQNAKEMARRARNTKRHCVDLRGFRSVLEDSATNSRTNALGMSVWLNKTKDMQAKRSSSVTYKHYQPDTSGAVARTSNSKENLATSESTTSSGEWNAG